MPQLKRRHHGRSLLIPLTVLRAYPPQSLSGIDCVALVDTGSTASGISAQIVDALDLVGRGKQPVRSVGGDQQSERYQFRFALAAEPSRDGPPAFPFVFEPVTGFGFINGSDFAAIVGMDILSQCDLRVGRDGWFSLSFG